jgi:hypothetical protein
VLATSIGPTSARPEITGAELFDGFVGGAEAVRTTPVAAELADPPAPPALLAVSCTRIVCPTSATLSV